MSNRFIRSPPNYLYRFLPLSEAKHFNWLEHLLLEDQLYFSSPPSFNDPFDCLPAIRTPRSRVARELGLNRDRRRVGHLGDPKVADDAAKYFKRLGATQLAAEAQSIFRATMAEMGVVCFSENETDVLMWSHYANHHKGVCLRFSRHWPDDLPLLMKVHYAQERATMSFPSRLGIDRTDELFNVLCTKAQSWGYENEWRLFWHHGAFKSAAISPKLIDRVILGAMATEETEQSVRSIIRRRMIPIQLHRATMDSSTFKVDIKPQRS
nr:DUF2971 domain-containing protein [uncultured Brevundimonas sp.]